MRKAWSRIFLLCMACMICMSGLCLAKTAPNEVLTGVNTANATINGLVGEKPLYINFWASWCDPCVGEMRAIEAMHKKYGDRVRFAAISIDDEAGKAPAFVSRSGLTVPVYMGDPQKIGTDYQLDAIPRSLFIDTNGTILEEHVGAMTEQELDSFLARNLAAPQPSLGTQAQPGGNVDVTGMEPPVPSTHGGTLANISGDIPYEVLDSGAVKFTLRRGEPIDSVSETYYLFAKPEEMKAWPGAYALGVIYNDKVNNINILSIELFDYDSSTNTIQWYSTGSANHGLVADPEKTVYNDRMRVMDKNTVYIEQADFSGALVAEGPFKIMIDSYFGKKYPVQFTIKYSSCADPNQRDVNGCQWSYTDYGGERVFGYDNRKLEAAILCCSLKGNLGEIPLGEDFEFFQLDNKYRFSR